MKRLSYSIYHLAFSAALVCVVLTSCLNGDDDNSQQGMSKQQIHECYLHMAGGHSGKMYFEKKDEETNLVKSDSIDISWTVVNDSVITIHDVPARVLGSMVENENLKAAIETAGNVEIKVFYLPYLISPISFELYPQPVKANIFYADATHSVTFGFYFNDYSWGKQEDNKMKLQLVQYGVYLDDSNYPYLSSQIPLMLQEK